MTTSVAAPALRFTGVSKAFGGTVALREVSFGVRSGAVHALCGGNGSGKSTLIKILAGVHQADAGSIEVNGARELAAHTTPAWAAAQQLHFVHQAVGTFADLSVAENFALGSSFGCGAVAPVPWRQLHARVQAVLDRFNLHVRSGDLMGSLPAATQTMVAVARALQDETKLGILVLDEPTASLPAAEAQTVLDAIAGYSQRGHTVIFVTHRLPEVLAVAEDATFLRDGLHVETRPLEGLGERDLVERIARIHAGGPAGDAATRSLVTVPDRPRLELRDYSVGPLRRVDLRVRAGEIIGISGLLGSGRSTLLQSLFGLRSPDSGLALLDGQPFAPGDPKSAIQAGVAYVPEDRARMAAFPDLSVRQNLSAPRISQYWKGGRLRRSREAADARAAVERYGVVTSSIEAEFSSMSGGNQQKVILARWLTLTPRLLLFDEPSQGVDVGARSAIHDVIRAAARAGAAVLVVSSDAPELSLLCDRVVGAWGGRLAGELTGPDITPRGCTELAYGLARAGAVLPGDDAATSGNKEGM